MTKKNVNIFISVILFIGFGSLISLYSQNDMKFSLGDVINIAQGQSPDALIAKHNFRAYYWQYRAFRANLLPTLNASGNIGNFNRSLIPLQDAQTGNIKYIENNTLRNSLSLSLDQNISLTGGTVSVYSTLDRLDQYDPNRMTIYNSQPINITYIQPLKAFNAFKWDKKIEPKEYDKAKRSFLESMENVTITATELYFNMYIANSNLNLAQTNYDNTEKLYAIAQERFNIGTITKSELLQLELRLLNEGLSINNNQLEYNKAKMNLRSFLGYDDSFDFGLEYNDSIPGAQINYNNVLDKAYKNSSFLLDQELKLLTAEKEVARAKSNNGFNAILRGQFGLTQQAEDFANSYRNPMDQEIVSLGFSMPILDWGRTKGKIKMAVSKEEVVRTEVNQAESNFRQNIYISVMQFNNQKKQCLISERANNIAMERYYISAERFANGTIGVTDLNMSQSEKDQAANRYLSELKNYWIYYFTLRKLCLFDFVSDLDISAEFDEIIAN